MLHYLIAAIVYIAFGVSLGDKDMEAANRSSWLCLTARDAKAWHCPAWRNFIPSRTKKTSSEQRFLDRIMK